MKTGIFRPGNTGKSLKTKIVNFVESSSCQLLLVEVIILLRISVEVVQKKTDILEKKKHGRSLNFVL